MGIGDPKVHFLIGGVQKAGTTALFRYLQDMPSLALAPVKEVHFFDDDVNVDWSARAPDYGRLHAQFSAWDGRPRGEATPIYLYWPNCLERIAAYNPRMRLIFIFREPVERAWSHWRMEYARDAESEPFAWAIREGRARVDSPEAPGFHRLFSYVERGFYAAQLQRVYRIFSPDQVLLLLSSDLQKDPDATLARVCHFVGVAPPAEPVVHRRELVGKEMDYPSTLSAEDRAYLRSLYYDDTRTFAALSGLDVRSWLGCTSS